MEPCIGTFETLSISWFTTENTDLLSVLLMAVVEYSLLPFLAWESHQTDKRGTVSIWPVES